VQLTAAPVDNSKFGSDQFVSRMGGLARGGLGGWLLSAMRRAGLCNHPGTIFIDADRAGPCRGGCQQPSPAARITRPRGEVPEHRLCCQPVSRTCRHVQRPPGLAHTACSTSPRMAGPASGSCAVITAQTSTAADFKQTLSAATLPRRPGPQVRPFRRSDESRPAEFAVANRSRFRLWLNLWDLMFHFGLQRPEG